MQETGRHSGITSIVIVTFNQLHYTKLCLESIWNATEAGTYELIVVDNGSTDGTVAYLREEKRVRLIENAQNRGFPAAANQGMAASSGAFVLLLNNDVVAPKGWLGRLLRPFAEQADLGLAGPCTNCVSGEQQVAVTYGDLSQLDQFAAQFAATHAGQVRQTPRLVGFCLLIRREVIDRIGTLDERFGIGNFEDDDFCRRARAAGWRATIVADAFVHHFGSATFKGSGVDFAGLLRKNQRIFNEKWSAAKTDGPPRISLCMIVRDSAKTISACLSSVQPWVDEMIVVDTGSTDQTREIARGLGAKVYEFPWCDSFAAARNESLRWATGEWIFWMDSDDTIDEANGGKLRELVRGAGGDALGYIAQVRCPPEPGDAYATATVVDHVKIFRNIPGIRFTGRIHEQVMPAIRRMGGEVKWTDICVEHSGSDVSAAGRERKHRRDLRLLEMELADEPDSTFAWFNMGMTLLNSGRMEEALNALCRSLQLAEPQESHVRKIHALLAAAYGRLGRAATGLRTCISGLAVCPNDPELMFRKGGLELELGRLAEAEQSFKGVLEGTADRYLSSLDRGILGIKAWHNLAIVHERQGRHDLAAGAWRRAVELDPSPTAANLAAWRGLADALLAAKDAAGLEAIGRGGSGPEEVRLIARARAMIVRGELDRGMAELEKAVAGGASVEVLNELCRMTFTADRLEAAERWLAELARRRPEDASAQLNLARVYWRTGRSELAAEHVRRSLELRPNYPPARELLDQIRVQSVKRSNP